MKFWSVMLISICLNAWASTATSSRLLIGKGLLEFPIFGFDLYEISYFVNTSDRSEEMVLSYKREIKRKYSQAGWDKGLGHILEKNPQLQSKVDWIKQNTVDVLEGDQVKIVKNKYKVSILKNEKLVSEIEDKDISEIIFEPWLGSEPVDSDLKKELLRNKELLK